ncbi:VPLPA-CTERM sorting domain-containing protein [Desulfonema magnum]
MRYNQGNVNVSAFPIPGAVWLLGSGLIGLAGIRRKVKKQI